MPKRFLIGLVAAIGLAGFALAQNENRLGVPPEFSGYREYVDSPHRTPAGVAFMIKRGTRQFAESGGWEFRYFPKSGDAAGAQRSCASCHHQAVQKDYIFGDYPR